MAGKNFRSESEGLVLFPAPSLIVVQELCDLGQAICFFWASVNKGFQVLLDIQSVSTLVRLSSRSSPYVRIKEEGIVQHVGGGILRRG